MMKTNQAIRRPIWIKPADDRTIQIIDQRYLPHRFVTEDLRTVDDVVRAIREMHVRGAPLIGVTAAFGLYLAALEAPANENLDEHLDRAALALKDTRPTGVNLQWAVDRQLRAVQNGAGKKEKVRIALETARQIADEDIEICRKIGEHGLPIIEELSRKKKGEAVQILTHCNAGWLACVEWGTATSPIYQAHDRGVNVHVWVKETRPRNQGASLTAWELAQANVPHTVIVDNAAGHLMQRGMVDLVLVGTDRTLRSGDVANKIGTYLTALAAKDNDIPFYVALPSSSIDWDRQDGGVEEIPIEERSPDEVKYVQGFADGEMKTVLVTPKDVRAVNYAFDVTPRRLITGLITERGIAPASEEGLLSLFPEKRKVGHV